MIKSATQWFSALARATASTEVTGSPGNDAVVGASLDLGAIRLRGLMRFHTTYIIGNGGSLAIAAHMATDFNLAGLRTTALVDPIALTSHANDFGIGAMFTKQLEFLAAPTDVLIALSCSGKSPNVINAARFGAATGMRVVTFSGFERDNALRNLGELNFYTPSHSYGLVQLAHESILHAACDIEALRWEADQ